MQYCSYPPSWPMIPAPLLLSVLVFFMIGAATTPAGASELPPNVTVPAIIVFGDSIVDTGNNNFIKTLAKCDFPPYGKDFMGGIPTGRFSNGRILTDFLDGLSVKKYVPAYLDPSLGPKDLLTGVSFASGSSGYDPLTCKILSIIPIFQQLEYFKEYIEKLRELVGEERTQFILTNSVFVIEAGNNDIATACFDNPFRRKVPGHADYSFVRRLVNFASNFIQELYNLGARRISVFGVLPVGCLPAVRTIEGGIILRKCAEVDNSAARLFNSQLSSQVANLASKLPNSRMVFVDIYGPFLHIIQNADKYGFEQARIGCCGTGLIELGILCNKFDPICFNDSKYLFWDSAHPSERAVQILVSMIIKDYVNRLFGSSV